MTTTSTQTQAQTQTTATRGRPLSKRGRDTKRAVERFLNTVEGKFTAADVRKATKQNKVTVRNRLNALAAAGEIKQVGTQPVVKAGKVVRSRPLAVYEKA
jgi:response regulator of citrate/malate metabolism